MSNAIHIHEDDEHRSSERRTWAVICLCGVLMVIEIAGGWLFGSIALVADGLHMSTHAFAMLLAALAYAFSRRYANDKRFSFGTGKLGDLAGFTSAVVLAMIAVLIGYEALTRLFDPIPIQFTEAIPIAILGLAVNVSSAWLLSGGHHDHAGHGHARHADHVGHDETHRIATRAGEVVLDIVDDGAEPRFRLAAGRGAVLSSATVSIETIRPDGARQSFAFTAARDGILVSIDEVPEPHDFEAALTIDGDAHVATFAEHDNADGAVGRDNNMRAALVHVVADAAVSALVISGLTLALVFGWMWMDPLAGLIGSLVIASWAYRLIRDTGSILLDMNPDRRLTDRMRATIESDGDRITDLRLWRLAPGHLGAIVSIATATQRGADFYRAKLSRFDAVSHLTVEVRPSS